MTSETPQGVLGSGENGVQKDREHGSKNIREQGAMESNLGSIEQKILGIVSKNLTLFLRIFFASLRSANFLTPILPSTTST